MADALKLVTSLTIGLFAWIDLAAAQERPSPAELMAEAIAPVCINALQSPRALTPEDFGTQFEMDRVRDGVTRLRHARGQPWVHLSLNAMRPGSCLVSFSTAGGNSLAAAERLADLVEGHREFRRVNIPPWHAAFTYEELGHPFDKERDPYIGYSPAAGYQTFLFLPVATSEADASD
jgi:hypothetical protein